MHVEWATWYISLREHEVVRQIFRTSRRAFDLWCGNHQTTKPHSMNETTMSRVALWASNQVTLKKLRREANWKRDRFPKIWLKEIQMICRHSVVHTFPYTCICWQIHNLHQLSRRLLRRSGLSMIVQGLIGNHQKVIKAWQKVRDGSILFCICVTSLGPS